MTAEELRIAVCDLKDAITAMSAAAMLTGLESANAKRRRAEHLQNANYIVNDVADRLGAPET